MSDRTSDGTSDRTSDSNGERRLDATATAAMADAATVTKDGQRIESRIAGVVTAAPVNHVDHRGRVFEIFAGADDAMWRDPVVYCYSFSVRRDQTKGWGLHQFKDDRYTLISGEIATVLYDARIDSPTAGVVQTVTLSPQGDRQLLIPTGVWHMNINLAPDESFLINHPTRPYEHGKPDRLLLPFDTAEIPVDIRSRFPRQFATG